MTIEEAKELKPGDRIKYMDREVIVREVIEEGILIDSPLPEYSTKPCLDSWEFLVAVKAEKV